MTATPFTGSEHPARPPGSPWPLDDAAAFLSVSARHLLRLADLGKVRTIRIGRRRLVPDAEVHRLAREGC
jgi:excisionase family DNA binding protein